jgi:hypothetical protein
VRRLLLVLAILLVVLVGLDFGGRWFSETQINRAIERNLEVPVTTATTDIGGFSFLWQAVTGRWTDISVRATGLQPPRVAVSEADVRLADVRLPLSDALSGSIDRLTAGTADGHAVITAKALSDATGVSPLALATGSSGGIDITTQATVLGQTLSVTADASVTVTDNVLKVSVQGLSAGSQALPSELSASLNSSLSLDLSLAGVPFPIEGGAVTVQDGDLVVSATASDVNAADLD